MGSDRLITIAIHTYDKAHELKNILENEGIDVSLQNVNLSTPTVSAGIRVRINESDLPLALRVIENIEIFTIPSHKENIAGTSEILVPVDFSKSSIIAAKIAFYIAANHKAKVKLINTVADPIFVSGSSLQLTDAMSFDDTTEIEEEISVDRELRASSEKRMKKLEADLKLHIKDGIIPPVSFSSVITDGLPEEVINDYARDNNPMLIVMGTRGQSKENRALIGSVTAEVLDTCRTTIMTIPESLRLKNPDDIREVFYFVSSKQQDILALDALYRLFPNHYLSVTLLSLPSKKSSTAASDSLTQLLKYCKENYPAFAFKTASLSRFHEIEDFNGLDNRDKIDLIAVPTEKKNIFTRLFNPTLAHKLLFHTDIPLLSIPV